MRRCGLFADCLLAAKCFSPRWQRIHSAITEQNPSGNNVSNFCVDFDKNEICELAVMRQDRRRPVNLCSVYADQVYALYDSTSQTATFELGGQIKTTTYSTEQLGHESVQDFLSGRSNFVPCETLD